MDWADEEAVRAVKEIVIDLEPRRPYSECPRWGGDALLGLSRPVAAALRRARAAGLRKGARIAREAETAELGNHRFTATVRADFAKLERKLNLLRTSASVAEPFVANHIAITDALIAHVRMLEGENDGLRKAYVHAKLAEEALCEEVRRARAVGLREGAVTARQWISAFPGSHRILDTLAAVLDRRAGAAGTPPHCGIDLTPEQDETE